LPASLSEHDDKKGQATTSAIAGRLNRTQWQEGQCGKHVQPVVEIIDEFFAGEIDIVEKGISRVSNFEALVLQL
jgi:hypothetical protein